MIEVKNLNKSYGKHKAVEEISFQVEQGQIMGLLGPNGAGKSTTMNMITGYLMPDSGTVIVNGADILKETNQVKKQIGYLPEIPPLYTDMTVEEYLLFVAALKKIPAKERKEEVKRVLEAVSAQEQRKRLIKNLSKGYRQRIGFAGALLGNPPVLILDEPTVGLDPSQIIEIRQLIQSLGKEHTIIFSSHILSEVSAICDHILIIDKGKVVAQDTPEGLSKAFSAKNQIHLQVEILKEEAKKIEEKLKEIFETFSWVSDYKMDQSEQEGIVDIQIQSRAKEDVRKELYFALAEEKIPAYLIQYENLSLEEVFLKVTGEEEIEHVEHL